MAVDKIELMCRIDSICPEQRLENALEPQFEPGGPEELPGRRVQRIAAVDPVFADVAGIGGGPDDFPIPAGVADLLPELDGGRRGGILVGAGVAVADVVRPLHQQPLDHRALFQQQPFAAAVLVDVVAGEIVGEDLAADVDELFRPERSQPDAVRRIGGGAGHVGERSRTM